MSPTRNPEQTRQRILHTAFMEIYRHGFQGMRVDSLLAETGLKKGALYHHFPSKQALGYAVLDEVIIKQATERWITPLAGADDPLQAIQQSYAQAAKSIKAEYFNLGCPLNNLAQEMSPLDAGFRDRIQGFFKLWQDSLVAALLRGQQHGKVRADINAAEVAAFIVTVTEGAFGFAKVTQDKQRFVQCGKQLQVYLDSLAV